MLFYYQQTGKSPNHERQLRDKAKEYFVHYDEVGPSKMPVAANVFAKYICAVSPTAECTELRKTKKC